MRVIGNNPDIQNSEVRAVASGALTDGSTVVVNSDGTVSVVSGSSVAQSISSPYVFEAGFSEFLWSTYDSANQKIVVAYRDGSNGDYGTAVVGTVSGNTISFGTPVVFRSVGTAQISVCYDSTAQKVVVFYQGGSNYGTARVGTVSGTSISFGSEATYETGTAGYNTSVFDAASGNVVVVYQDGNNSDYGTACVGTVSGTSISFGTPVVFDSSPVNSPVIAYDSVNQKVGIFYASDSTFYYGQGIVGTVSGTSISFGSSAHFNELDVYDLTVVYDISSENFIVGYASATTKGAALVASVSGTSLTYGSSTTFASTYVEEMSSAYDSANDKVVITYQDSFNSSYGTLVVGTVSGTSISFDSPAVFNTASSSYTSATYDPINENISIFYRDGGNSFYGTAVVFQNAYTSTNLTSENFIGFSKGAFSDGDDAVIFTGGAVSDRQTSLTPAQTYYVQTDGSLSTTAGDPSVLAGTAISNTDIIVKG